MAKFNNFKLDGHNYLSVLNTLQEVKNAMAFLTNNKFTGGDKGNNDTQMVMYMSRRLCFNRNGNSVTAQWVRDNPKQTLEGM